MNTKVEKRKQGRPHSDETKAKITAAVRARSPELKSRIGRNAAAGRVTKLERLQAQRRQEMVQRGQAILTLQGHAEGAAKPTFKWLPIKDMIVDPRYQRPVHKAEVGRIAANMDLDLLGVWTVNVRDSGEVALIDGQQRREAFIALNWLDVTAPCNVYTGLTVQEEAEKFYALNGLRVAVSTSDKWKARLVAGEKLAVDISAVAHEVGYDVPVHRYSPKNAPHGALLCYATLEKAYTRAGRAHLKEILTTIMAAWGVNTPLATSAYLVGGMDAFLMRYRGIAGGLDMPGFIKRLAKATPVGILQSRRTARGIATSANIEVARVLVDIYNARRTTDRFPELPEWRMGARREVAAVGVTMDAHQVNGHAAVVVTPAGTPGPRV